MKRSDSGGRVALRRRDERTDDRPDAGGTTRIQRDAMTFPRNPARPTSSGRSRPNSTPSRSGRAPSARSWHILGPRAGHLRGCRRANRCSARWTSMIRDGWPSFVRPEPANIAAEAIISFMGRTEVVKRAPILTSATCSMTAQADVALLHELGRAEVHPGGQARGRGLRAVPAAVQEGRELIRRLTRRASAADHHGRRRLLYASASVTRLTAPSGGFDATPER